MKKNHFHKLLLVRMSDTQLSNREITRTITYKLINNNKYWSKHEQNRNVQ